MRKLILVLPFFFLPAMASAGHGDNAAGAAYSLDIKAQRFYQQVAYLPRNWRLKQEARQFLRQSQRLARQVTYGQPPRRLLRTLQRLNNEFYDLRYAVAAGHVHGKKRRQLRRQVRKLSRALSRVENTLAPNARLARNWSNYGYRNFGFDDNWGYEKKPRRRYRN